MFIEKNDIEEKWVVVLDGMTFLKEEIRQQFHFLEDNISIVKMRSNIKGLAMSLGYKRETAKLEQHDKRWDDIAIQTIKTLKSILGDEAVDIQHIGSTATPVSKRLVIDNTLTIEN